MQVSSEEAVKYILAAMQANLVTMMSGSPGIGKSAIVQQIAKENNLHMIDVRLSQCDPTDLLGFPFINKEHTKASYIPMDIFPLAPADDYHPETNPTAFAGTPVPDGKSGFLLFLDEINASSLAVQAASYKLILDKQVGQHKLHPKTRIVAAGNLITDKAIVNRQSTAMQSRLVHMELVTDPKLWQEWAASNNIDHRILAYISSKPDDLYNFKPDHNDHTFAFVRTWEFVSKIINHKKRPISTDKLSEYLPLLAGTIGEGVAQAFVAHTNIYTNMPSIQEIIARPKMAKLDNDPAFRYGVSHMIAAYADKKNMGILMDYIDRLPIEFQTITLQNVMRRNAAMIDEPPVKKWITVKGQALF